MAEKNQCIGELFDGKQTIRRFLGPSATTYTSSLGLGCTFSDPPLDNMRSKSPHHNVIMNTNCAIKDLAQCDMRRTYGYCFCSPHCGHLVQNDHFKYITQLKPSSCQGHMLTCSLDGTQRFLSEKCMQVPNNQNLSVCKFEISPFYPGGESRTVPRLIPNGRCQRCQMLCPYIEPPHLINSHAAYEFKHNREAQTDRSAPKKHSHGIQTDIIQKQVIIRERSPSPIHCHLEVTTPEYIDTAIQSKMPGIYSNKWVQALEKRPILESYDVGLQTDPIPIANTWVAHTMEFCDQDTNFQNEEIKRAAIKVSKQRSVTPNGYTNNNSGTIEQHLTRRSSAYDSRISKDDSLPNERIIYPRLKKISSIPIPVKPQ